MEKAFIPEDINFVIVIPEKLVNKIKPEQKHILWEIYSQNLKICFKLLQYLFIKKWKVFSFQDQTY